MVTLHEHYKTPDLHESISHLTAQSWLVVVLRQDDEAITGFFSPSAGDQTT